MQRRILSLATFRILGAGNGPILGSSMWHKNHSLVAVVSAPLTSKGSLHSESSNAFDHSIKKFRNFKRIFAFSLFTGTLMLAWYLKKQKGQKIKAILEDFTRIPIDESLFGAQVSLYRYKGYIFPGHLVMSGVFQEIPDFKFKEKDVIVASFPKSGTTWVQEIVYMLCHDCQRSDGNSEVLETRFPYLEYPYPGIRAVAAKTGPRLIKTHLPLSLLPPSLEESNAKVIYIARNPRDAAISYYHFLQLLTQISYQGTLSSFINMFLSDTIVYGPFFDHVLGYWQARNNANVLFLTYEELQQQPFQTIRHIADFLEVEASNEEVAYIAHCTSFTSMAANPSVNYEHWKDFGFAHKDKGKFMRKGKVGDWQSYLSAQQLAAFEAWEKKNLENSELKFAFTLPSDDVETEVRKQNEV